MCNEFDKALLEKFHTLANSIYSYSETYRPWGYYIVLAKRPGYLVKELCIFGGKSTSYQFHKGRCESHTIISGTGKIRTCSHEPKCITDIEHYMDYWPGRVFKFDIEQPHQIIADTDTIIQECWFGQVLDENDIVRLEC